MCRQLWFVRLAKVGVDLIGPAKEAQEPSGEQLNLWQRTMQELVRIVLVAMKMRGMFPSHISANPRALDRLSIGSCDTLIMLAGISNLFICAQE